MRKNKSSGPGFERLRRAGKLNWTTEALVTSRQWRDLFEDEEIARAENDYCPPDRLNFLAKRTNYHAVVSLAMAYVQKLAVVSESKLGRTLKFSAGSE